MSCLININPLGDIEVQGDNASLFEDAFALYGNDVDALNIYLISQSDEFQELNLEPTVDNIVNYIENRALSLAELPTKEEMKSIHNSGTEGFLEATTDENGRFALTRERMATFYTESEIDRIFSSMKNVDALKEVWRKISNNKEDLEDIEFRQAPIETFVEEEYNILGKKQRQNPDEAYKEQAVLFAGVQSIEDVDDTLNNSDYSIPDITEEEKVEVVQEFSDKRVLPVYTINPVTNELTRATTGGIRNRILNGLEMNQNFEPLLGLIDDILGVDPQVLESEPETYSILIQAVEQEALSLGIDVRGLTEATATTNISDISNFLLSLRQLVDSANMDMFVEEYHNIFPNTTEEVIRVVENPNLPDTFLLDPKNKLSEEELFRDYSIVRIKDNIYLKVNSDIEDVTEVLYNMAIQGSPSVGENLIQPFKPDSATLKNRRNKLDVKEAIKQNLIGLAEGDLTLAAFKQIYAEPDTPVNRNQYKGDNLAGKEEFVTEYLADINKLTLKENLPIVFTENGVELEHDGVYTAHQLRLSLSDSMWNRTLTYAKLTNSMPSVLEIDHRYDAKPDDPEFNRNFYSNFKNQITPYRGVYRYEDGGITTQSTEDFIKVRGLVYEKAGENYYREVPHQDDILWDRPAPREKSKSPVTTLTDTIQTLHINKPKSITEEIDNCA